MEAASSDESHYDSEKYDWQEVKGLQRADPADHMVWASCERCESSDSEPEETESLPFMEKVEVHPEPEHLFWNSIGVPCAVSQHDWPGPSSHVRLSFQARSRRRPSSGQVGYKQQESLPPGDGLTSGAEADLDASQSDTCVTSGSEAPSRKAQRDQRSQDCWWKKRLASQVARSRSRLRGESLERRVLHTLWDPGFSTDEDAETCATVEEEEGAGD